MPPNDKAGKVVFIGNIPYGVTEELIVDTLSRVGQVVNFRLVYDKDTGRPKGFGFAEFSDGDAAASAVRNLNDYDLMGRKLRVDWSNDNGSGDGGDSAPAGYNPNAQQYQQLQHLQPPNGQDATQASSTLPPLPPGADLPPGLTCPDAISKTLNTLPAPQLLDIISQMKGLVMSDPAKATELLRTAPQLAYAIFQALLLLGLIDTSVLASVIDAGAAPAAVPQPPQPPMGMPQYPGYPPVPQPAMHVPTPPVAAQPYAPPPPMQTPQPAMTPEKEQLIRTVLALTQQQIDALPVDQRAQIMALKQQIMTGQLGGF